MLHLLVHSPFERRDLESALTLMADGDALVLLQDAVVAVSAPQWVERLREVKIYVMQEDLTARGLNAVIGTPIAMSDLVTLIAEEGSPLSWR